MQIPKPRTRAGKVVAGLVSFVVVVTLGIALAVFFARAPITGGATSGDFEPTWNNATITTQSGVTCTATVNAAGTLNFNVVNALPGASCTVEGAVALKAGATTDGRIAGLALNVPAGWTAALTGGCGQIVSPSTPKDAAVTVTMGSGASPGQSSTFGPQDGVLVQPIDDTTPLPCATP